MEQNLLIMINVLFRPWLLAPTWPIPLNHMSGCPISVSYLQIADVIHLITGPTDMPEAKASAFWCSKDSQMLSVMVTPSELSSDQQAQTRMARHQASLNPVGKHRSD